MRLGLHGVDDGVQIEFGHDIENRGLQGRDPQQALDVLRMVELDLVGILEPAD
jgi:hypothetical protein